MGLPAPEPPLSQVTTGPRPAQEPPSLVTLSRTPVAGRTSAPRATAGCGTVLERRLRVLWLTPTTHEALT